MDERTYWLDKYRDYVVEVMYLTDNNMYRDKGQLTDIGDQWIELHKGGAAGELFLIPVTAIRLVKVLGPAEPESCMLLRPAQAQSAVEAEIDTELLSLENKLK